jgi:hypothetical protein
MPRVAPVTTTDRPAMDVNMLAFPFPAAPGLALSPADLRRLPRTCAPDLAGAPQPSRLR